MAVFEALNDKHKIEIEKITNYKLFIFEELFGFTPQSFVAQSLIFGVHLLSILSKNRVEYI